MAKSTFGMDLAEFAKRIAAAQKAANELGAGPKATTAESTLFDIYLAGVEVRRGKLSKQEREELRNAWLAGYIAAADREGEP